MVIDTFMFFNELDILLIRLDTLYNYVDKFILVESDKTFTGVKKPLYYEENRKLFKEYSKKLINVVYRYNENLGVWDNEYSQRNYAINIINDIHESDDDIILSSDVDEIFNPTVIDRYKKRNLQVPYHCGQTFYLYYINVRNKKKIDHWKLPVIMRYKNLYGKTLTEIRLEKEYKGVLNKGGWHFSYMGGLENIKLKIKSFSHQELNNEKFLNKLNKKVKKLVDFHGARYQVIPINGTFPPYVIKHKDELVKKGLILDI